MSANILFFARRFDQAVKHTRVFQINIPIPTYRYVRISIMGFGIGPSSNGKWTTVSHAKHYNTTFQHLINNDKDPSINPYEVLIDNDYHKHNEFTLSNRAIVFSTCSSLDELITSIMHMYSPQNSIKYLEKKLSTLTPMKFHICHTHVQHS